MRPARLILLCCLATLTACVTDALPEIGESCGEDDGPYTCSDSNEVLQCAYDSERRTRLWRLEEQCSSDQECRVFDEGQGFDCVALNGAPPTN